ncbi:Hint domain-containing protein [Acetobacter orleanensis]|nr:Hint domain-containing protein [Acetobacter orleanensis]
MEVLSGGVASNTTLFSGGIEVISAGGTAVENNVAGGRVQTLGLDSHASVVAGEIDALASGAVVSAANVTAQGTIAAISGGILSGNTIGLVGTAYAGPEGIASGNVIDGGYEIVGAGGLARNETVIEGGRVIATGAGALVDNSVVSNGLIFAQSGAVVSGNHACSTGQINASSGGSVTGNTFDENSIGVAFTGGSVSANNFHGSAQAQASSGGSVTGNTFDENSIGFAYTGGSVSSNNFQGNAQAQASSGGSVTGNTFNDDSIGAANISGVVSANDFHGKAQAQASSGGSVTGNTFDETGLGIAYTGGFVSSNSFHGSAQAQASSGGSVTGNTFDGTSIGVAYTGGFVSSNSFHGSAQAQASSGGSVTGNIFDGNSIGFAYTGGIVSSNDFHGKAQAQASSGGSVTGNTFDENSVGAAFMGGFVSSNNFQGKAQVLASSGGSVISNTFDGNNEAFAYTGGIVSANNFHGNAQAQASSGGSVTGNLFDGSSIGAVFASGLFSSNNFHDNAQAQAISGGSVTDNTFDEKSAAFAYTGGFVSSNNFQDNAQGIASAGGSVTGNLFDGNSIGVAFAGGLVSANTVQGMAQAQASSGGIIENNTLLGSAKAVVFSSGVSQNNILGGSSSETVSAGGLAVGEILRDSGTELDVIGAGAVASGTQVHSGARLWAGSSGFLSANMISGGTEQVDSGGQARGDTLLSGAFLDVFGSADHMTLENSIVGVEYGGTLTNTEITSGSTLEMLDSGTTTLSNVSIDIGAKLQSWNQTDEPSQFTVSGNQLIISNQGGQQTKTLTINATPEQLLQVAVVDGSTGLFELEEGTPCYCRGTLIATDRGDVPVEYLKIGDQIRTLRHGFRPIRWIGRRAYSGQFAAGNRDVLPVTFRAGSLGKNLPQQDLSVSPLHAMYLDGVLVPAAALVNGRSIVQAKAMDEVAYFHIELESHDVIFANGAESETFVDDGSRGMFHNAAEYNRLYPDAVQQAVAYCAPRVEEGARLNAIRRKLNALTGKVRPGKGPLEGYLDSVTRTRLAGWAVNPETRKPVRLQILDRGVVLGEVVANQPRADLGRDCGFIFEVPGGLSPLERHVLEVRRVDDHSVLGNSPWMLDQAGMQPLNAVVASRPASPLKGYVDTVSRDRLAGWAFSPTTPDEPVALQILDNGQLVASVIANALRPDVRNAGACPTAQCGFDVLFPAMLSPFTRHVLEVRREQDGAMLGKPHVLEPVGAFDPALEDAVSRAVASVSGTADQDHILSFLFGQVEKLAQARAQADSGQYERDMRGLRARRGLATAALPPRRRLLVIDSLRPDTGRDAGSHAVLSHIQAFQALGYEVSLVAADQMTGAETLRDAPDVKVLVGPVYHSVEDVLRRQAGSFDVVYLHRADNATRYLALVRMHQKKARVVYNIADLHYLRLARQGQVQQRPEVLARAQRMKLAEYATMLQADVVLTHSVTEAEQIRADVPQANVHVVPWAVPVRGRVPGFARRSGVLFLGNYAHAPNADAARWLVEDIMPRVWKQDRSVTCLLAGAEMSDSIHALARRGVETLGRVEDLNALFDRVRLSIAPLRFGAGIKGKVLDSFAAGVPCVMTPVAAEGLLLPKGMMAGLVRENSEDLAQQILSLHKRPAPHASLCRAGRTFLREGWMETDVQQALVAALQPVSQGVQILAG